MGVAIAKLIHRGFKSPVYDRGRVLPNFWLPNEEFSSTPREKAIPDAIIYKITEYIAHLYVCSNHLL